MVRRLFRGIIRIPAVLFSAWVLLYPCHAQAGDDTFSPEEVTDIATGVFGAATEGIAQVIEAIFSDLGRPNAYITGEELSGAFFVGLRYGKGELTIKNGGTSKIFWQGPSVGVDIGGNASKTFVLVYGLDAKESIYRRFPGIEGSIYYIAGLGVNYQGNENMTLAPIRTGVGLRQGANVGYLHYNRTHSWLPF